MKFIHRVSRCEFCNKMGQIRKYYGYGRCDGVEMALCILHVRIFCHIRRPEPEVTYPADRAMFGVV